MTRKLSALTAANTEGGAHPKALQRLGVTEPDATVTLEQMVTAMIQESDNAVPDYLRDRLGDAALADAAAQGGWDDPRGPDPAGLDHRPPRSGDVAGCPVGRRPALRTRRRRSSRGRAPP
jgi:hypothetical protein